MTYVTQFITGREGAIAARTKVVIQAKFNPNLKSSWFTSVMQIISNLTMITVILTGAALIREREQGTVEHLLVMPVVPSEIMLSKILANGVIILIAAGLSLLFVVQWWLQVPIAGSTSAVSGRLVFYVFTVAALGIALGTVASTMGQFGLLSIPVLLVMMLLSGSTTPMESMPVWLAVPDECHQPDAAFRGFLTGCALSWSGFFHRLAGDFGDGGYRQYLFWGRFVSLSPGHFQRLSSATLMFAHCVWYGSLKACARLRLKMAAGLAGKFPK